MERLKCVDTIYQSELESPLAVTEKNDCGVRSIASAFDITYDEAHAFCKNVLGRTNGTGTRIYKIKTDKSIVLNGKKFNPVFDMFINDRVRSMKKNHEWRHGVEYSKKEIEAEKIKLMKQENLLISNASKKVHSGGYFTLAKMIRNFGSSGTYIVVTHNHMFTVKNGVVYGNSIDSHRMTVTIQHLWKIY